MVRRSPRVVLGSLDVVFNQTKPGPRHQFLASQTPKASSGPAANLKHPRVRFATTFRVDLIPYYYPKTPKPPPAERERTTLLNIAK